MGTKRPPPELVIGPINSELYDIGKRLMQLCCKPAKGSNLRERGESLLCKMVQCVRDGDWNGFLDLCAQAGITDQNEQDCLYRAIYAATQNDLPPTISW